MGALPGGAGIGRRTRRRQRSRGGVMNLLQQVEQEQVDKLAARRPVQEFQPGDTLRVGVKVVEGERERIQLFEGVCIGRKNAGVNSNFTLRKISYGEGVERIFPLYSPRITSIDVVRRGVVRRAKLYYLRGLTGKAARITERARDSVRPGAKRAGARALPQTDPTTQMAGAVEETNPSERTQPRPRHAPSLTRSW